MVNGEGRMLGGRLWEIASAWEKHPGVAVIGGCFTRPGYLAMQCTVIRLFYYCKYASCVDRVWGECEMDEVLAIFFFRTKESLNHRRDIIGRDRLDQISCWL